MTEPTPVYITQAVLARRAGMERSNVVYHLLKKNIRPDAHVTHGRGDGEELVAVFLPSTAAKFVSKYGRGVTT